MRRQLFGILIAAAWVVSCGSALRPPRFVTDTSTPAIHLTVIPDRAWTATGINVHAGDRLFFAATGAVTWAASSLTTSPDGDDGVPGWTIGRGGLIGRVGEAGRTFDVGARTTPFMDIRPRPPHHPFPPPPIKMREGGALYLGFKDFRDGPNTGAFDVTIRRSIEVDP